MKTLIFLLLFAAIQGGIYVRLKDIATEQAKREVAATRVAPKPAPVTAKIPNWIAERNKNWSSPLSLQPSHK